jgi:hypothetical protein
MLLVLLIFGSGHGLSAPVLNQRLYWLVDLNTLEGQFYSFLPGFGAQLTSWQWRRPQVGEARRFGTKTYVPYLQRRGWVRDPLFGFNLFPLMWEVSWRCADLPDNPNAEDVRALEKELVY